MQPLYNVGENTAFGPVPSSFTVVSVAQEVTEDSIVVETMVDSGNNLTRMVRGAEHDTSYHAIDRPARHGGVVVPYVAVLPEVQSSVPEGAEWVFVGTTDFDYWRALCGYWEPSFDLRLCEHDVIWRQDVSDAFGSCPEPWCVFPYHNHSRQDAEAWGNMLGCTRFRKELIAELPEAVMSIEERWRDWHYLCDGLGKNLRDAGYSHHWHLPPVVHIGHGP